MQLADMHPWHLTYQQAVEVQERLRPLIRTDERLDFRKLKLVAGCDVAYETRRQCRPEIAGGDLRACFCAVVVVMRWPSLELVESSLTEASTAFPYIPGLLTFREGPALQGAFEQLRETPDVIIFDGQGIAHPRRMGLAAHMGLLLDVPTIGAAKSRLYGRVRGEPAERRGSRRGLYAPPEAGGDRIGTVLRTRSGVKPLYVSCGHRINLPAAERLVLNSTRGYRLPEPIRAAHRLVNRRLRELAAAM